MIPWNSVSQTLYICLSSWAVQWSRKKFKRNFARFTINSFIICTVPNFIMEFVRYITYNGTLWTCFYVLDHVDLESYVCQSIFLDHTKTGS
jgi:uncharacterized membrane protein